MKISLNWLKDYIDIDQSVEKVSETLTDTGLEVEGVEEFGKIPGGLEGIVIGEVLTCEKHPNADKLKITTVDIGSDEPAHIVCGAPNVEAGQKVIVATVGTTLYPDGEKPFKIKKAKIRGEVSEGMICAEDEIGLGTSHEGIMVLNTDLPNGTPAKSYFNLEEDYIIEIGLTPNRADATSHIGVARDLKAVYNQEVKWPEVSEFRPDNNDLQIDVEVQNQEACPRYSGLSITNARVEESPQWLQNKLISIGLSPINNVVDTTNFILHELGQPLHAFDADQIKDNKVIVKTLPEGTKFTTLDEKERSLKSNDLMICNGKEEGMCIAGIFGGINSGVTEKTTNIFLESAYFSPDYIRKTAQHHQLKTDASFRYERGTDPEITVYALKRAALLIKSLTGGMIASEITDLYPEKIDAASIEVKFRNVDRLIGKKLDRPLIVKILESLDIKVSDLTEESFTAHVPPYRVDVTREADIIEEVLRIYGFNNVEVPDFVQSDYMADFPDHDKDRIQKHISELLVANGFYEIVTNSLTKPGYAETADNLDAADSVPILNKLSEDLGVMRQSLLYSMLEVAVYNINRKQNDLKLFEFGKTYFSKGKKYKENERLGILMTGSMERENWRSADKAVDFHDLSAMARLLVEKTVKEEVNYQPVHQFPLGYGISVSVNNREIGRYGKIKNSILKKFDISQEIFYADFNWNLLLKQTNNNIVFEEVSKFPEVRRDLSLVIDKSITFEEIKNLTWKTEKNLIRSLNVFDVY
ncbi:MAG: phenylalanine--tRNA ligase subunit beta, partial [Fulvivirga sp.]|nr:phenylalanine--tRNA ligase subunit beta [Fulvivirga sp.]